MIHQDTNQTPRPQSSSENSGDSDHFISQIWMGLVICALALLLGWGVWHISAPTVQLHDGGVWLAPGLTAVGLLLCGIRLLWETCHGGWRYMPVIARQMCIAPWIWVSSGLLLGGLSLQPLGFVVAATVCYVLSLQGLRLAVKVKPALQFKIGQLLSDVLLGLCLAAVVYALYVHGFSMKLPSGALLWR